MTSYFLFTYKLNENSNDCHKNGVSKSHFLFTDVRTDRKRMNERVRNLKPSPTTQQNNRDSTQQKILYYNDSSIQIEKNKKISLYAMKNKIKTSVAVKL